MKKPVTLSIAGFDPSAGAGVLADIKAFEQNGVYGMGVVSALTFQNDTQFDGVEWVGAENMTRQLEVLLRKFDIRHFKIGLIESMDVLQEIVGYLRSKIAEPVIVWDPILKASSGFVFHEQCVELPQSLIESIYCITPNIPEAIQIFGADDLNYKLELASEQLNIYLKGGHSEDGIVTDLLFVSDHTYAFPNDRLPNGTKHGSGCVLSAALTAQLALGLSLPDAAELANAYTYKFLASNDTLLGYHQMLQNEAY